MRRRRLGGKVQRQRRQDVQAAQAVAALLAAQAVQFSQALQPQGLALADWAQEQPC